MKIYINSFAAIFFIFSAWLMPITGNAQNSTIYGVTASFPHSKFVHFDPFTGSIQSKTSLGIIEQLGTSTFDHKNKNYFIAGYRDSVCYLLTIHAPSGKIIDEMEIEGNSEWHGFEFNHKTGKIYGTRWNLTTYEFFFAAIDPYQKTYEEFNLGNNAASQTGSAMDYEKGLYFYGTSRFFNLSTIDIKTGTELHNVDYALPTGAFHFDTLTNELYGFHTSVPRVSRVILDYENEKHKYDSVAYLRTKQLVSSWYTYDRANHNYLIFSDDNTFNMINTQKPEAVYHLKSSYHVMEMEYDSSEPDSAYQVSGQLKTSAGEVLNDAMIYAATKNASGNFEFKDSTGTSNNGYFTLTTTQKQFYILVKPYPASFPNEAPTWYPGTVRAAEAELYLPKKGIDIKYFASLNKTNVPSGNYTTETQIKIFPNPSKDKLNIQSDKPINRLEVASITGKVILRQYYTDLKNITLPLPYNMESGVYYIQVHTQAGITRSLFVKR